MRAGFTLTKNGRRFELVCDRCEQHWTLTTEHVAEAIARRHDQRHHGASS